MNGMSHLKILREAFHKNEITTKEFGDISDFIINRFLYVNRVKK